MNKKFTLIEIIVVIVIMAILSAIIIPLVGNSKKDSIRAMIESNTHTIQTAVDTYSLKNNGTVPTAIQPTLEQPQLINVETLYPKYIKSKPDYQKVKNQKYWVDAFGKVWGATEDSPSNIFQSSQFIEWKHNSNAKGYQLYAISTNDTTGSMNKKKIRLLKTLEINQIVDIIKINSDSQLYLISTIDEYGLESAPAGLNYSGAQEEWFTPMLNKAGKYEFEITSDDLMFWDGFKTLEDKPVGTNISYEFAIKDSNGNYSSYVKDFYSLEPSKGIKILVNMEGTNGVNPTLYDMRVFYHFDWERVIGPKVNRVSKENLTEEGVVINPLLPVKVTDQFTSSTNKKLKEIIVSDSYSLYNPPATRYYQSQNGDQFVPITSFETIPENAIIRIEREYKTGENITVRNPVIRESEEVKTITTTVQPNTGGNDDITLDDKWTTVNKMNFFAHSGDGEKTHWIRVEPNHVQPDKTRILYRYSTSNGGGWTSEVNSISAVSDSRSLRVSAYLQVETKELGKVDEPTITSLRIFHEKGTIDLDSVKPTVAILPIKSNNQSNTYFSELTTVDWQYEAVDPRGKEIVAVEWSGDKRTQYPIGTYEVKARVLSSSNYWSNWVTYKFTVKPEKPVAVMGMSPSTGITTDAVINWSSASSYDPDGDGIVKEEWQGKQNSYSSQGNYTVRLRVQDQEGNWSDWVEKTFFVFEKTEVVKISTNRNHALALLKNGTIKSWGYNYEGQLGDGTKTSKSIPVLVPNLNNVIDVEVSGSTSFALLSDGTVWSWGKNYDGILGTGSTSPSNRAVPQKIEGLANVKDISAGERMGMALLNDGRVMIWGAGYFGDGTVDWNKTLKPTYVSSLTNIKEVTAGYRTFFAIDNNDVLYGWGLNNSGELGNNTTVTPRTPVKIMENVKQVSNESGFSFFLLNNGDLLSVGENEEGQLGDGTLLNRSQTKLILQNVKEVEAGYYYGIAVMNDKTIKTWGDNNYGQLGVNNATLNILTPQTIEGISNAIQVNAASFTSFVTLEDGNAMSFGNNGHGLLGQGSTGEMNKPPNYLKWVE